MSYVHTSEDILDEDEALAWALQEEYDAEQLRISRMVTGPPSQRSTSSAPRTVVRGMPVEPSAPTESEIAALQDARARQSSSGRNPPNRSSSLSSNTGTQANTPRTAQEWRDEQYARRLEKELRKSQEASRLGAPPPSQQYARSSPPQQYGHSQSPKRMSTPATSRSNSMGASELAMQAAILDDEELARRIQQEQADANYARNITVLEARRAVPTYAQQQPGCFARLIRCLLPMVFLAGAATMIYFFVYAPESIPEWVPSPEDFANEDPFSQVPPGEADRWKNQGQGLSLVVVNALEESWYPYFFTAVSDWDAGTPDVLALESQTASPDSACESIAGVLKVCNGDYGETYWRGINKLLIEGIYIYASAARMNEYYFRRNDDDQRQYTMCHEIGHGFGLPHSDESFTNKDLGNCMDYTNRPSNNRQPDSSNFLFLEQIYGVLPGSQPSTSVPASQSETVTTQESVLEDNNGGNRLLLRSPLARVIPDRVLAAHDAIDREIELGMSALTHENGWSLVHRTLKGEAHEKHLGDGFKVRVHMLRA